MAGNHRRIFLFAAKTSAGFGLDDADPVIRQIEQDLQRPVHVVGTLQRPEHRDAAAGPRDGDDAVWLDVQLLLMAGPVLALDDDVGEAEAGVEVSLVDGDLLEDARRRFRIVGGRRGPVSNPDVGRAQRLAIFVREQQHRLGDVPHRSFRQARLVVVDQRHDIAAGNVAVVHDDKALRVEVQPDVDDLTGRDRRADGSRVQQVGERQVVDVSR